MHLHSVIGSLYSSFHLYWRSPPHLMLLLLHIECIKLAKEVVFFYCEAVTGSFSSQRLVADHVRSSKMWPHDRFLKAVQF